MAKRFTDTAKYKKPFIRGLPGAYKLLWDFLYHDCDHAGIWIVDFETAQIYIGKDMPINKEKALKLFNASDVKIIQLDGGEKWFLPSFIEFQYVQLSETNRAHTSVISVLNKYKLLTTELTLKNQNKPLISPLQGGKDMDMDKEQEKEKEKDKEQEITQIIFPFNGEFLQIWDQWKVYKLKEFKFKYKSVQSEQAALHELATYSGGIEKTAIEIILQSMAKGWKGLFELKTNYNGHAKQATGSNVSTSELLRAINSMPD